MSQIFQAFPPLQILPLHCFNPISFDLILFSKPTLLLFKSGRYQKTFVHHCFNPAFGHARMQPRKNAHPGSSSFQSG
ncbi:hypothetical protein Hanom_Chr14g01278091 [Helianthus anomalus]